MKKFLILITTFFYLFLVSWIIYWVSWDTSWGSKEPIEVKVTEKISGANCEPKTWPCPPEWCICKIEPWFNTIQSMIWWIIKWVTVIAALGWILFIVINWIMLSMWWEENTKTKERIIKTVVWLILLLLSWVILSIIAPWVYK